MTRHNPYASLADDLYWQLVGAQHVAPSTCAAGTSCITVAAINGFISIQDSKLDESQRQARTQIYTTAEMEAFLHDVKAGRYDGLL
jgi:hypothetical protein